MAEQFTADEIVRETERLEKALQNGWISHEEYNRGLKDVKIGLKNYTNELQSSKLALKKSVGDLVGSMKDGAQGASQYGDALSSGADYISKILSARGPLGFAIGQLVKGATMYVNTVSKQSDALMKSYNEISRTGATAAGGITELYTNMQKFGYGIAELGNLAALVQENAENLALLGGTVFEGTTTFSNLSKEIRDSNIGFQFEKMGINVDNMNKGIGNYLRIQTLTGQQQLKTQEELRAGAEAYVLQQDRLTKLTGASADEQQKIREQALSEERFAASQRQLRRRAVEEGNAALAAEADRREELNTVITKQFGPEAARGFRDSTANYLNSPDAQKFLRTFPEARKMIMEGADSSEIQEAMIRGAKATGRMTEELGKMGKANEIYINQAELTRAQGLTALSEAEKIAKEQQQVDDGATDSLAGLARQQRRTRDALQDLIQIGIRPVTAGMEGLSKVIGTVPGMAAKGAAAATSGAGGTTGGTGKTTPRVDYKKEFSTTRGSDYMSKMIQAESGGRNIRNLEGSNAFGVAQIMPATFEGLVRKAGKENPLYGKTFEDMKADVNLQMEAARQLTDENRSYLQRMGVSTSDAALYLAHFLGPNGAVRALTASDSSPIRSVVSPDQLEKNSNLRQMTTVAELKRWADQKMGGGGYQYGGIASGPGTGYMAMLHGTEAIVPLPDGKSIPVEIPGFTSTLTDQTGIMAQQLNKLDELVRVMQNQVSLSNKILQRTS